MSSHTYLASGDTGVLPVVCMHYYHTCHIAGDESLNSLRVIHHMTGPHCLHFDLFWHLFESLILVSFVHSYQSMPANSNVQLIVFFSCRSIFSYLVITQMINWLLTCFSRVQWIHMARVLKLWETEHQRETGCVSCRKMHSTPTSLRYAFFDWYL